MTTTPGLRAMRLLLALIPAIVLPAFAPAPAHAQTVWRCGAGANVYSQTPCDGGREVAVADERSPDQVQAAQEVAARERRLADQLSAERQPARSAADHGRRRIGSAARPRPGSSRRRTCGSHGVDSRRSRGLKTLELGAQLFPRLDTAGLTGMQLTGQTCTHCGSSKWPTHSVQRWGSIS